jgi:hypothetical protein
MAFTEIDKPSDYFNTKLYTGTGATQSITGVNFQPDWTWIKNRTQTDDHKIFDAVRGVTKVIKSNTTGVEGTDANTLTTFGTDGFTVGSDGGVNGSSEPHVSWNWLASNTTASNTDGSITSTVSASTTSGFSIVSYQGTGVAGTIGHGLGVVPKMIIIKRRTAFAEDWLVYHASLGATKNLKLNTTAAEATSSSPFNNTAPTSTVFSVESDGTTNSSSSTYIAYCFAEKKGFSKFGSYTGNSSTDGTFVYTGFRPAWVLIKVTNTASNWFIQDNKRLGFNASNSTLNADLSDAESSTNRLDILSNGFKLRNTSGAVNSSANTYIYMAFASEPFTTSTGIPCTAR